MKKILFIFGLVCLLPLQSLMAQFDAEISNYWDIPNIYNPGSAGRSDKIEVAALGRLQWVGITNAPRTIHVAANMPYTFIGREHGVGISMYNGRAGLFSTNVISAQYAYKTTLWGGDLGIGVQVGYISESFQADSIYIPSGDGFFPDDSTIPTGKIDDTTLDVGFGVYYSNKNFYAGLSVTHLIAPELELNERYTLEMPRAYYFLAGYNIQLNNSLIELQPSVLIKSVEPSSYQMEGDSIYSNSIGNTLDAMWKQTQLDLTLRMTYNKKLWMGVSWRGVSIERKTAVVGSLGVKLKNIEIGYAYDYPLTAIRHDSGGSHELVLKYVIDAKKKKKKLNKHKSVRIL